MEKVLYLEQGEKYSDKKLTEATYEYAIKCLNMLLHDIDEPRIYHDNSLLKDVLDYTEDGQLNVALKQQNNTLV